ncbi:MAG: CapA family protein, partial [Spirochaetia bacterium]|nr:CapA family protein [Spirochaetia bacterium]
MKQSRILILCIFLSVISCTVGTARGSDHHSVSFSVVGDIMQHDLQIETAYNPSCKCYEYKPVFEPVKEYLEKADITIGNLETTLPGDPKKYSGYPEFGAPDSLVTALDYVGFDILTTANNHSLDKGKSGLKRTIKVLDQKGIVHLGTYSSHTEHKKNRVLFVHKNGIKFALLNYTYGTNGIAVPKDVVVNLIDDKKIMEDMALAREAKPDVIVVLYHFGGEYLRQPDEYQKKYVNLAFNEGADIVLGGHPHVLQPFEVKNVKDKFGKQKNRLVIYSLGNF